MIIFRLSDLKNIKIMFYLKDFSFNFILFILKHILERTRINEITFYLCYADGIQNEYVFEIIFFW